MSDIKTGSAVGGVGGVKYGKGVSAEANISEAKESDFKAKLEAAAESKDDSQLREVAREFEAYFLGIMLKQMRKTVIDGGLIEKSEARKHFESMLDDEYAKNISSGEGIGIASAIYEAMKRAYE